MTRESLTPKGPKASPNCKGPQPTANNTTMAGELLSSKDPQAFSSSKDPKASPGSKVPKASPSSKGLQGSRSSRVLQASPSSRDIQPVAKKFTMTGEPPNSKDLQLTASNTTITAESPNSKGPQAPPSTKSSQPTANRITMTEEPPKSKDIRPIANNTMKGESSNSKDPQPTAKRTSITDGFFKSRSQPTQLHETAQLRFFEIVLRLIGTIPPLLSLATARLFSPLVWWILGPVLGIFASYILVIWMCQPSIIYVSNALAPLAPVTCWIVPGSSFCPPSTPALPYILDEFRKGLNFGSQLAEMQAIGANNYDIPYLLEISEGSVGSIIVQLSSVDLPSKEKLLPLLYEYRERSAEAIEGLVETFVVIDQSVDDMVNIITWVTNKMESIGQPSVFARIRGIFIAAFLALGNTTTSIAFPTNDATGEIGTQKLFIDMTDVIYQRLGEALVQLTETQDSLRTMQGVLYNVAWYALNDNSSLDAKKMKEASSWKWIFQGYRNKMSDYDEKMITAASFYNHTEEARMMLSGVISHMRELRANARRFRNTLQEAPTTVGSQVGGALQLYVDILRSNIDELEESRRSTKKLKREKKAKRKASRSQKL